MLPISDKFNDYAAGVAARLKSAGLRAELDDRPDKIGSKIRTATMDKVPFMLVCGEREVAEGKVAVRHRTEGDQGAKTVEEVVTQLRELAGSRKN